MIVDHFHLKQHKTFTPTKLQVNIDLKCVGRIPLPLVQIKKEISDVHSVGMRP